MTSQLIILPLILAALGTARIGRHFLSFVVSDLEKTCFSFAIGSGVVSIVIFLLGLLQLWSREILSVIVYGLILLGLAEAVLCIRRIPWHCIRFDWISVIASLLLVYFLGMTFRITCGPVADWDGLSYHLAIPKLYLEHGGIYWIDFLHHSNFPLAIQMLYALPVALNLPSVAASIHWLFFLGSVVAVGALAYRLYPANQQSGFLAALLFAGVPIALWEATVTYVDLASSFYVLLSALALIIWQSDFSNTEKNWLILSGVMAGLAGGVKLFNLVWLIIACTLIAFRNPKCNIVKDILIYICSATLFCFFWYLKSFLLTGNPVYPFFFGVFGGKGWGTEGIRMYEETWVRFGVGRGLGYLPLLPWHLMTQGGKYVDGGSLLGTTGPGMAALLPCAVIKLRGAAQQLLVVSLFGLVIWYSLTQQTRYLMPFTAILCVLCVVAVCCDSILNKWAPAIFTIAVLPSALLLYLVYLGPAQLFSGQITDQEYLSRHINSYQVIQNINQETTLDAAVLLYGETRGFYLQRRYRWADEEISSTIPYKNFDGSEDMLQYFKKHGWNLALINWNYAPAAEKSRAMMLWQKAIKSGFVKREETLSDSVRRVEVYRIL